MKKGILSFMMSTVMMFSLSSNVFAQEINDTKKDNKETTLNLTIKDVLDRVKNDNLEIKIIDQKIELLSKIYSRDKAKAYEAETMKRNDVFSKRTELIIPKQSSLRIDDAEHEKDKRLKEIKHDLENQYLNLVNSDREIEIINKSIENVEEEIKKTNAKISQGVEVTRALESLNVKKAQLLSSLSKPKLEREEALIKIKQYLNIDKDTKLNLAAAKIGFVKYDDSKIEEIIDKALANSYDLIRKNKELEISKEEEKIYSKYGRNTMDEETDLRIKIEDLENDIVEFKANLKINYWKAYYNVKAKQNMAEIEMLNLENAKSRYTEMDKKFKEGMIDKLQLNEVKLQLDKQNVATERAINEYMIIVDGFKDLLEGF
ncbi:TolC family protein [Clostridium tetanomorphum]|uniref:TolC family protein n=1 Tax=Clostridium tetanomorphum TaxID=1553 RepID=A0A923IZ66_CLOTT|nr:TolC family protein [Clostridium tetanomorphum]MBC2397061.1 TolC family protein [Clostridium tetanomorphum]NRZ99097.1 hypothetical protein [Clostridium tetanomorphum]